MSTQFALGQEYGFGQSFQEVVLEASPAAGASFTHTEAGKYRSRLIACEFSIVTSSTVADRYVTVEYLRGGVTSFSASGAAVLVEASSTQRFVGSIDRGVAEWNTGTDIFFPLAKVFLEGGAVVKINVSGIDTTDQLSGIVFTFDRFPTQIEAIATVAGG